MQKKLIALAVAGVLAAPMAAQAAATAEVYGKVRVSAGFVGNDDQDATHEDSKLSVTSHDSRFGVKGAADLDNGMKATYQFETEVDFDDDDNGIFDSMRNTYVGLKGDFGEVRIGRHDTPYKMSRGKLDPFGDTHGDYNAIMGDTHDARADNVIAYLSPDMSGFMFAGALVTDIADDNLEDTTTSVGIGGTTREQQGISLAGMYSSGPLYAALAFQSLGESGVQDGTKFADAEATKLTLGYMVGTTNLMFAYEMDDLGGSNNDQDRMYFSVDHGLGGGTSLQFAYGMADDRGNTSDSGATHFALGVTQEMGDSVEMYALYTALDNDQNADFHLVEVESAGTPESTANAFAVGVNMKFSSM